MMIGAQNSIVTPGMRVCVLRMDDVLGIWFSVVSVRRVLREATAIGVVVCEIQIVSLA
jgi:hypothetical protein